MQRLTLLALMLCVPLLSSVTMVGFKGAAGGGGNVTVDAVMAASVNCAVGTDICTATNALTLTGAATCLVIVASTQDSGSSPTPTAVEWNDVTMGAAVVTATTGTRRAWIWAKASPATGLHNIDIDWDDATDWDIYISAIAFAGTNTSDCIGTTNTSATAAVTVTAGAGTSQTVAVTVNDDGTSTSSQTLFYTFADFNPGGAASRGTANGTATHTFTNGGSTHATAGAEILAP